MKSLLLLFPRLVADRAGRAVVATAVLLSLTVPLCLREGSAYAAGLSDGLSVGGTQGATLAANLVALGMALAAAWMSEGAVSGLRREGIGPLVLTRPVSRSGLFLARWLAGFTALAAVGLTLATTLNGVWRVVHGAGYPLSAAGAIGAAAVIWVWVGSAVLLFSSALERGEGLAGGLLFIVPISLASILSPGTVLARIAGSLPSQTVLTTSRDLLAGRTAQAHALSTVLIWGSLILALGVLVACRREWRTTG